jgi:hypothetical protein
MCMNDLGDPGLPVVMDGNYQAKVLPTKETIHQASFPIALSGWAGCQTQPEMFKWSPGLV